MPRTVSSLIRGTWREDAPGGTLEIPNPRISTRPSRRLGSGDATTFVEACRAAREAQQRVGARAGAGPRARDPAARAARRGQRRGARAAHHARDRQADPRVARLGAGGRRHLQLLRGRGASPLRHDGARASCPTSSCSRSATRSASAAIVTAGNFPVAVPSWYLVPALLCGNAVVWKPAEYAPATAKALAQLFVHAGFPPGVFNMVLADGPTAFEGLERRSTRGWSTRSGSPARPRSGAGSASCCGRHLQSPCLELGGKNPLVVMPDADLDLAVEGALFSGFGTAGQRCTSLGTAIVHASVHDEFVSRFAAAVEARRSATRSRTCCTAR